jgi:hypothetical protein
MGPEKALYNRSLFDPELRGSRELLIKTLVLPVLLYLTSHVGLSEPLLGFDS